jgi:hypothetical protein
VRVHHDHGLPRATELAIGITDARGRVRWTPAKPGLSQLQAAEETITISIAYPSIPIDTIMPWSLICLAGLAMALYGASAPTPSRR